MEQHHRIADQAAARRFRDQRRLPAAAPFLGGCFLTGGGCFCVAGPFTPDSGVLAPGGVMFFGGNCEGFN